MAEPTIEGFVVKQARLGHNWTQGELARRVKSSTSTISMIETGERSPSPELAARLETKLGLDAGILTPDPTTTVGAVIDAISRCEDLSRTARFHLVEEVQLWARDYERGYE